VGSDQVKSDFQDKWLEVLMQIKFYLETKLGRELSLDLDELIQASITQPDFDLETQKQNCLEEIFLAEMRNQRTFRDIFNIQRERSTRVLSGDLEDISSFDAKIRDLKAAHVRRKETLPDPDTEPENEAEAKSKSGPELDSDSESDSEEGPKPKSVQWDTMLHFDDDDEDVETRREAFARIPHVHVTQRLVEMQLEYGHSLKILTEFKASFRAKLRNSVHECWARSVVLIQKQEDAEFRTLRHDLESKLKDIDAKVRTLSDELLQLDPGAEPAVSLLHSNYNLTVDLARDVVFAKYLTALWNLISKL